MLYYTNISHILKKIARIQRRKCLYTHLILCVLSGGVSQLSGGVSQLSGGVSQLSGGVSQLSGGVSLCVLSGGVSLRVHRKGGRDRYCVGNSYVHIVWESLYACMCVGVVSMCTYQKTLTETLTHRGTYRDCTEAHTESESDIQGLAHTESLYARIETCGESLYGTETHTQE